MSLSRPWELTAVVMLCRVMNQLTDSSGEQQGDVHCMEHMLQDRRSAAEL